jgi:hypothetical protein
LQSNLDILNKIGSGETLLIEKKYENPFEYTPFAKIIWACTDFLHFQTTMD